MRAIIIPLLLLASCSDGGDGAQDQKAKAEAQKNLQLAAGQWETVTEVTKLTQQDEGAPAINTPEGTKVTVSQCVAEAEGKKPAPALLAGSEDYDCQYDNFYMSSGTLNAQLTCRREGLAGNVMMSVDGSYTGDTIEATQSISTSLSGTGDVTMETKLTGRRTGPTCAPADETKEG